MSIYTWRSGATSHPEDTVLQFFTDYVNASGVLSLGSDHFKCVESATPDMNVKVKQGRAYVKKSTGNTYPVRADADASVAIAANSSGNPRIDAIVLYIDTAASPTTNADNVAKLSVVQGTPGASPSAPSDGDIATAIGSANPFLRLGEVFIASGATSITNSNITDKRVRVTLKGALSRIKEDTDGSTVTFDMETAEVHTVTLGGNRTLAFANVSPGQVFTLMLKQDGTGNRTVTWPGGISWPDGVAPTLTPTANKTDVFTLICIAAGSYLGFVAGQNI